MSGTARHSSEVSRSRLCFAGSSLERLEHALEKLLAGKYLFGVGVHRQVWQETCAATAIHGEHKLIEHLHCHITFPRTPNAAFLGRLEKAIMPLM